jgi:hypothetical protein
MCRQPPAVAGAALATSPAPFPFPGAGTAPAAARQRHGGGEYDDPDRYLSVEEDDEGWWRLCNDGHPGVGPIPDRETATDELVDLLRSQA